MKISKTKKEILKYNYDEACNAYVKAFMNKHGYDESYWVADEVGGKVCIIEQYFFDMQEIIFDIQNSLPKGLIFDWQDKCVDNGGIVDIENLQQYYKIYKSNRKKKGK